MKRYTSIDVDISDRHEREREREREGMHETPFLGVEGHKMIEGQTVRLKIAVNK